MDNQKSENTEQNKSQNINKPHDKGYKKDLKKPSEFLHFLKKYVGAEWTKELEISQLTLCDKEFISRDYEGKEADILYSVKRKDGNRIYVFVIQELQSTIDQTMIFRVLVYIMNVLTDCFLRVPKNMREKTSFRLPAIVPIVFYNGKEEWTAVQELKNYCEDAELFGEYTLNLKYYLVDLNKIEEEYILSTNTTIDNIMYCDKFREKTELLTVINGAIRRVEKLGKQETEDFLNWAENILLTICGDNKEMIKKYLEEIRKGGSEMAFEYNIVRIFREDREKAISEGWNGGLNAGRNEGIIESIMDLLSDYGTVPNELYERIKSEEDVQVLKKWLKISAKVSSIEEFEEKIGVELSKN